MVVGRLPRVISRKGIRLGREGGTDKLIVKTGIYAPRGMRWYVSIRFPFTRARMRRFRAT